MRSLAVFLSLLVASGALSASDTMLDWSLSQQIYYDDNYLLKGESDILPTNNTTETWAYIFKPAVKAGYKTPQYEAIADISLPVSRFSESSDLNSFNQLYSLNQIWLAETTTYKADLGYSETDLRNTAAEDAGNFASTGEIHTTYFNGSVDFRIGALDTVTANIDVVDRTYTQTRSSNDNTNKTLGLAWGHVQSPRLSYSLNSGYSEFESDGSTTQNVTDYTRLTGSVAYRFSPLLSLKVQLGYWFADSTTQIFGLPGAESKINSDSNGELVLIELQGNFFQSDAGLTVSRDLSPGSNGFVNKQDKISTYWKYSLSERLSSGIDLSWVETEQILVSRKYASVSPFVSYQLAKRLMLKAFYLGRYRASNDLNSTNSNRFVFQIDYQY